MVLLCCYVVTSIGSSAGLKSITHRPSKLKSQCATMGGLMMNELNELIRCSEYGPLCYTQRKDCIVFVSFWC